ncbi:hypothetical protein HK096_005675, partial [Nowakowskiella sp. JEL0078]
WISEWEKLISEVNSHQNLFYYQNQLVNHIQFCLDTAFTTESSLVRYLGVIGLISEDFTRNCTSEWQTE